MRFRGLELEPGAEAPRAAREWLRTQLTSDGLDGLEEEVLLVVSELVTNAAVHARTTMELSYGVDGGFVEVGVRDGGARSERLVSAAADCEPGRPVAGSSLNGRGLLIVSAIADAWGVTEFEGGKRVWARWRRAV